MQGAGVLSQQEIGEGRYWGSTSSRTQAGPRAGCRAECLAATGREPEASQTWSGSGVTWLGCPIPKPGHTGNPGLQLTPRVVPG